MIVDALKTLSYKRLTRIGFVLFGIILGPCMFIFQFAPHVFKQNEFLPLIFISICVGLPVALVLFVLRVLDDAGIDPIDHKEKMETRFQQMATCSIMTGFGFYIPCCYKYFQLTLTLRDAVGLLLVPFFLIIAVNTVVSILQGGSKRLHDALNKKAEEMDQKQKGREVNKGE